ncbi:hypothetical protein DL765_010289 [Monosporascus sp. GIB2]|nr:hypothetical protein DL765_010289 [Monosporascus sp. GIB2]
MSSFLAFPGLPINAGKDLVHWNDAPNALSRSRSTPTRGRTLSTSAPPDSAPAPSGGDGGSAYIPGAHTVAYFPEAMHLPLDLDTGEIGEISRYRMFGSRGHADLSDDANWNRWLPHSRTSSPPSPRIQEHIVLTTARRSDPRKCKNALNGVGDLVSFSPSSKLPTHFVHHRLPASRNYIMSLLGHPNALALGSSVPNLTGFGGDFGLGCGQTFVGCHMVHSVFGFRVDVDWADALKKEGMEGRRNGPSGTSPSTSSLAS